MIDDKHFSNSMTLGVGYRFKHKCPSGEGYDKPLVVTRMETGWKWYCHRCQDKGIKHAKGLSPKEWLKFNKAVPVQENQTVSKVKLPHGMTKDIPALGLAWLYSYHLNDEDIAYYNIQFSTTLNRVVLPVYDANGALVYYQARNLAPKEEWTPRNPKYMNVKARSRFDVYFDVCDWDNPTDDCVVVEDIISAIRVGKHLDTVALLNAYIPDDLLLRQFVTYERVILWLDPDKWDRMGKKVKRFRSLGYNVLMIRANQDPKYYTSDEISEKLEV